jgi:hypothetical protein
MNLTETLRQRLSQSAAEPWQAPETHGDVVIDRLLFDVGQGDIDAIRLIFDRIDGPAGAAVREAAVGELKPLSECCRGATSVVPFGRTFGDPPSSSEDYATSRVAKERTARIDCLSMDDPEVQAMIHADAARFETKYPARPFIVPNEPIDAND